jgi:hypothetical protein
VTTLAGHHPLHALGTEVRHLGAIANEGESTSTLPILIGFWLVGVACLVALVVALAFGVAYLGTGSSGTSYPAPGGRAAPPGQSLSRPAVPSSTSGQNSSSNPSTSDETR